MKKSTRLFIVEDSEMLMRFLKAELQQAGWVNLVGEAHDGEEALERIPKAHPDVVLLDLGLPKINGVRLTELLRAQCPGIIIIWMTGTPPIEIKHRAHELGVHSILYKNCKPSELVECLKETLAGHEWFSPTPPALDPFEHDQWLDVHPAPAVLTDRELEILRRVARCQLTKQIAADLHISARTVDTHREHICCKLRLNGGQEMVRYAIGHHLW